MPHDRPRSSGRWAAPWYAPYAPLLRTLDADLCVGDWARCIAFLDRRAREAGLANDDGRPLRFVDARAAGDEPYEAHIWATGGVPTRTGGAGGWHDLFNALVWLTFPRTKARLNLLQARAIAERGAGADRGGLRDAATLFDENAALFVTRDRGLVDALRGFDWQSLFVADPTRFQRGVRVLVFGHALLDKLRAPYKSACAHAWVVDAGKLDAGKLDAGKLDAGKLDAGSGERVTGSAGSLEELDAVPSIAAIDAAVAASLDVSTLSSAALSPLPVLGVPGWWPENRDPRFYDDSRVFRPGRRSR